MGAYYQIKVLNRDKAKIKLEVIIIDPSEEEFYTSKTVALQYLWTNNYDEGDKIRPLLQSIPVNLILDKKWVIEHCNEYIKSVEILETFNYPADDYGTTNEDFIDYNWEKLPKAVYEIEVSEVKWIEHLSTDDTWLSAAYDMQ